MPTKHYSQQPGSAKGCLTLFNEWPEQNLVQLKAVAETKNFTPG